MVLPTQLSFFQKLEAEATELEKNEVLHRANLGTFQDSLRAPVHLWFTYPAGFSYKAVEEAFRLYHIKPGMTVYDPFAGTATTNVVATQQGVHSFGVEAHPFVHFVGQTKLCWNFSLSNLLHQIDALIEHIRQEIRTQNLATISVKGIFPELVCKCYSDEKLACLYLCREVINRLEMPFRDFAKLGLTHILRSVADVATGWPYIAPQKAKRNNDVNVIEKLQEQLYLMYSDVQEVRRAQYPFGKATLIWGDSRQQQDAIESQSIDLAFTSPPYLNNYDYSDRTRLEMYFWGEAANWGDINRRFVHV